MYNAYYIVSTFYLYTLFPSSYIINMLKSEIMSYACFFPPKPSTNTTNRHKIKMMIFFLLFERVARNRGEKAKEMEFFFFFYKGTFFKKYYFKNK